MEEDHNRVSQQWVSQVLAFFYSVWPLVVGFGLLEFVAAALFKDPNTALVGATLIFFASLMLVCKWITTRGRPQAAVALLCAGFLVCTLFVALVARGITPTLALTPFLAFGIALPFFDDATLKRIAVAVWLCSVLAVLLGDPVIHSQLRSLEWYSRWSSSAPDWYVAVFRLASLATASGVVLVLLWRFRIWINDQTLRRIREAEQRYSLVERGSNDGLWDWDIKSGQIYLSARFSEMLGLVAEVRQGPVEDASWLLERLHPEDRQPLRTRVREHLAGVSEYFVSEHRMRHDDGAYRWMLVRGQAVRDSQGGATRMAGSQTDVTRRRLAEDRARHDALHDPLTGLANRQLFSDRLCEAVSRSRTGGGGTFSLLFMDLDRFKSVNDSLGHGAGDELLVCVAERLTSCVSRSDTVARLGGDEFVVLLDGLGETALAEGVAQMLLERLQEPFTVGGHTVLVTASIGVLPGTETVCGGMSSRAGRTVRGNETLLRDADTAMYHAKEAGKSRFATFEPRMREETLSLLSLETDLRAAIEGSEFTVAYQPIVWLASGEVVGFEALARWWHAERGQVSPEIFVTLAQDLGLVHRIDRAVLREACRTMAQLRCQRPDGYPISVSVNLSPAQLDRPGLLEEVDAALQENGLPGEALKLELTETAVMGDFVAATRTLSRLKALGVGIHIDDFGTGHSSLALLYRLPADALKIDRTFITGLSGPDTVPADNDELVQTIVHLGHQLGLEVVAEGVETDAQLGRLRQIGCDYAQGFRFSRPVPAREAATILEAEPRW